MQELLLHLPLGIKIPILIMIIGIVYFSIAKSAENDPEEKDDERFWPYKRKPETRNPTIEDHEENFYNPTEKP